MTPASPSRINAPKGTRSSASIAGAETLGPSSRRTGLVVSEIMYHPAQRADGKNVEFIELFNSEPLSLDLGGYRLSGDLDFTFPTNTIIQPNGFLVVAPSPAVPITCP